jgi:hypothetical protein
VVLFLPHLPTKWKTVREREHNIRATKNSRKSLMQFLSPVQVLVTVAIIARCQLLKPQLKRTRVRPRENAHEDARPDGEDG